MNENVIMQDYSWASPPMEFGWIWSGVGLSAIVAVSVYLYLRRRKKIAGGLEPIRPHAHESALRALEQLLSTMSEDRYAEFVNEVSRVLRVYIQDRYEIRAPHRATEEFLAEATEDTRLSTANRDLLADFLHRCDLVKFARRQVILAQMRGLLGTAKSFVEETMLAEAEQPVSATT